MQQQNTEQELPKDKDTERLLRALADNLAIGIYIVQDGKFRFTNSTFQKLAGYSKEELAGMESLSLVSPEDRDMVRDKAVEMLKGKSSSPYEFRYINSDGKSLWVMENVVPVRYRGRLATMGNFMDITERKQTEEKYKQLLEDINEGYAVIQEGNFVFTNRKAGEIIGRDPEQALAKSIAAFMVPEKRQWAMDSYERVIRGEKLPDNRYEAEMIRADGTKIVIESSNKITEYDDKPALSVILRDITQRKRMEEQIRHRLEIEKAIIRISTLFSSQSDVDLSEVLKILGEVTASNRAYIFQFRNNCDKPEKTYEWCSQETEPQTNNLQDIEIKLSSFWTEKLLTCENIFIPDTTNLPDEMAIEKELLQVQSICSLLIVPVNITGRNLAGFMGFDNIEKPRQWSDEDVSLLRVVTEMLANYWERRRTEAILRHSEERIRLTFASVQEGVIIADLKGKIIDINEGAIHMHGYANKDEIIGQSCFKLIAGANHEKARKDTKNILEKGWMGITRYMLLRKNGSKFPAAASPSVLRDSIGQPAGFTILIADVTERQKRQEQLMLTDRLASIGQLASGIAHELNNPLTGIIGLSDLMLEKDLPEEIKEDLESVVSEAKRAANIIKGLLAFVRNQGTEKMPEDINRIIQEILSLRAYEQKIRKIEVHASYAPELPRVIVNGAQMQQVFMNLVINAEQAMLETNERGRLQVITENTGDMVRINISDDGPGISHENMKRLFTPFFTTKDVGQGTGLGLSICHGIVTEHGGRIYADSEPGKGATFIVELPVLRRYSTEHQEETE